MSRENALSKKQKQKRNKQNRNDKKGNSFEVDEQKDTSFENSEMDKSSGSFALFGVCFFFCFFFFCFVSSTDLAGSNVLTVVSSPTVHTSSQFDLS